MFRFQMRIPAPYGFMFLLGLAVVLIVTGMSWSSPAFAQAVASAPVTYSLNLKPLLDAIVGLLGALLTGLGSWAVTRFSTWLKLQNDSQVRAVITGGVNTAIGYAMTKLQASADELATVKTQNQVVAEATTFLAAHFPDALKYFGLSTMDLSRMILARLPSPVDAAPVPAATAAAA